MTTTTRRNWLSIAAIIVAICAFFSIQRPWSSGLPPSDTLLATRSFVAGRKNTVLLLTNREHGLSNVVLATANSLLTRYPEIDLHIASFEKLGPLVQKLEQYARKQSPSASVTFHKLPGLSFGDKVLTDHSMLEAVNAPGFFGTMKMANSISMFFMPWTGPEYLEIYEAIVQVLEKVDPAVVAVDPALGPAVDAVKHTNRTLVILSANTVKENAPVEQGLAMLWKFPMLGSGYPYPLPWYLIPLNVILNLRVGYKALTAPHVKDRAAWLSAHGLNITALPPAAACADAPLCIVHSLVEAELPYYIPSHVRAVGPMVLSMASAAEQDPELAQWLGQRPTVIINMGSLFTWDEAYTTEMAHALAEVLARTEVQVLWKLQKREGFSDDEMTAALTPVSEAIADDRVRVSTWIKADPTALMETGNVVLAVHHGGASSFYEPLSIGIPQLLLPQWVDCYDNAVRAEYTGVGLRGHKKSAPALNAAELTTAFMTLLGNGTRSDEIRRKAKEIGEICQKRPGRDWAADELVALARRGR